MALLALAMVLGAYSMSENEPTVVHAQSTGLPAPLPNCPTQVPVGQANPSAEAEPLGQIWCFPLVAEPTTRVTGANDWVDNFNTGIQMGHLNDGEMGYRVFDVGHHGTFPTDNRAGVFVNNNHWMVDYQAIPSALQTTPAGAVLLSPNRTFQAENGTLVVEADVAALTDSQGGADNFVELDVAPQAAPDADRDYYGYGQFSHGALGCRFEKDGTTYLTMHIICSQFSPWPVIPLPASEQWPQCASLPDAYGNTYNCLSDHSTPDAIGDGLGNRLWEAQDFECNWIGGCHPGMGDILGNVVVNTNLHGRDFVRVCGNNQMDMYCRDRIRMEVTKTTVTIFINGGQVLQLGPLPNPEPALPQNCHSATDCYQNPSAGLNAQIPDALLNNASVFYTTWINHTSAGDATLTRTHWGRVAVNPHNADGSPAAPSASPSYCFGMPQNTCPMPGMPMADPTPMPTSMPMPTSAPTSMPMPTSAPTSMPMPTSAPTSVPMPSSTGSQSVVGFDDLTSPDRVLNGQYPAGVIDWGTNAWWLSSPWGQFRSNSISYNGSGPRSGTFKFLTPRQLVSLDAYNGDASPGTVTLSCAGQPTVTATIPMGSAATIRTGWTSACSSVTISTSNGWATNFDNLVIQ